MRGTQGCTHTSRSVLISFDSLAANVISSVATGLLTALISVRLALRRFRSERLWDRRVQAYSNLFEALFHVKAYTKRALDRIEGGGDLNDDYMKELAARSGEGYREIRKAVVIGVLALGPDRPGGFLRNHAQFGLGVRGMRLDLEPDPETCQRLPNGSHFRAAIAGDHGWAFNRLGGPMASGQSAWNGTA